MILTTIRSLPLSSAFFFECYRGKNKKERYDVLLGDSKEERYAALDPMDHPTFINNAPMSMGRKRTKVISEWLCYTTNFVR